MDVDVIAAKLDALRELCDSRFDQLDERADRIEAQTTLTNGRLRENERIIAVHEDRWQQLRKAASVTQPATPDAVGVQGDWKVLTKVGAILGGILAGLSYGAWRVYQMVAGK